MARLLERLFVVLVTVTLVLWVFEFVMRWLTTLANRAGVITAPFFQSVMWTVVGGCFGVGLMVRLGLWIQEQRRASTRQRTDSDRRTRFAVRRPTEDPHGGAPPAGDIDDVDPALHVDEERDR